MVRIVSQAHETTPDWPWQGIIIRVLVYFNVTIYSLFFSLSCTGASFSTVLLVAVGVIHAIKEAI